MPLVRRILGDECKLLFQGVVVAEPGANEQAIHSDGPHLEREHWAANEQAHVVHQAAPAAAHAGGAALPTHALTVFVPLVEVNARNGATYFLPGTQQTAIATAALDAEAANAGSTCGAGTPARLEMQAGSAILFDYRTFHAGSANLSDHRRSILYFVFAKPWFDDDFNFPSAEEASLDHGHGAGTGGSRGSGLATALPIDEVRALSKPSENGVSIK